jgi:hypothetical protein
MDAMAKQATDAGYAIPMGPVSALRITDRPMRVSASQPQPLPLTPYRSCCP